MRASPIAASFVQSSPYHSSGPTPSTEFCGTSQTPDSGCHRSRLTYVNSRVTRLHQIRTYRHSPAQGISSQLQRTKWAAVFWSTGAEE
ncbi:hypothetical protein J6590_093055 [Homalodisca vitripennis]|nr:hypothetical protein J6590_093055 [Homalodisca vitripennis]